MADRKWRVVDNPFNRAWYPSLIGRTYTGQPPAYMAVEDITARIRMTLKNGDVYLLDGFGRVVSRSDGPQGHDYSGKWRIEGFLRRHNSSTIVTLAEALDGIDIGHGWVVDLDHGTRRVWAHPTGRRCESVKLIDTPVPLTIELARELGVGK